MGTKIAGTRRAGLTRFYTPRGEGSALPKSVERGSLSLDKAVIRWTSGGGRGGASPQPCNSPRRVLERDEEKWNPVFRPHPALNF